MLNLIVFIACSIFAIFHWQSENILFFSVFIILGIANSWFGIKWLVELIKR